MPITIKKNVLFQILFAICIGVTYLGNYELTFLVWSAALVLTLQRRYSVYFLKYVSLFIVLLALAFLSTDYAEIAPFYFIRDITYLLKPIIGLVLGYQFCKFFPEKCFRTIIYCGIGIAIIHLILIANAVLIYGASTVHDVRYYSGYFSDFEVYALILLIFKDKFGVVIGHKKFILMVTILGLSAFLYMARSHFIQFFILALAVKGYFVLTKRAVIGLTSAVLLAVIGYSAILYINPKRNGEGLEALLYKIKIAPTEPFARKIDVNDYIDYNDNYRSVEMNLTIRQVTGEGTPAILFGKGLGSQVDLKRQVFLGDMDLRYISVLHNSFMTIFLKTGLLGVIVLLYSIVFLYRQKISGVPSVYHTHLLLRGTAVFLLASNWVLMGYYFTMDSKSVLVGLFIAYCEIKRREQLKSLN